MARLLGDPELARRVAGAARERVLERYLGIQSLLRYGALIETLAPRQQSYPLSP